MNRPPFDVALQLENWGLFWAELETEGNDAEALGLLRENTEKHVNQLFDLQELSSHPTVNALRQMFRGAGCDPTRYRPSSEALIRRLLKGNPIPEIHPLVDVNNCLSARLAIPCCVMTTGTFESPLVLRTGEPGESYESLKGPFNLEKKPILADPIGPVDAPITGSKKVMVQPDTKSAWLVAYFPLDTLKADEIANCLREICEASGCVKLGQVAVSGS
jgi:DNA/RNA-binding domain of Phe-tRNA-synthetase-like protein